MRRNTQPLARRLAAAALIPLLGGLLAACGSDSDASSIPPDPAKKLTKSPIVVGAVCTCTGVSASSQGGIPDVVRAWQNTVNENGGIDGHPVKVVLKQDGGDATTALNNVKELVEEEGVIAIIGDNSNVDVSWADYVAEKGIPVVGGSGINAPFLTNPMFFPSTSPFPTVLYGAFALAREAGKSKVTVPYCAEAPQCALGAQVAEPIAESLGMEVVSTPKFSMSATDYTSACLGAKEDGADAMFVSSPSSGVLAVASSCAQQGFNPTLLAVSGQPTREWLQNPNLGTVLDAEASAPFFDDSTEATKEYREALKKWAPDLYESDLDNGVVANFWTGGKLFEAAAKAAKIGDNATSAQVLRGLYALPDGETLGGLVPPLTFADGEPSRVNCYFVAGIEDSKFTTPQGLETECAPLEVLGPILQSLAG